jgi:hypothetical protein
LCKSDYTQTLDLPTTVSWMMGFLVCTMTLSFTLAFYFTLWFCFVEVPLSFQN